MFCHPFFLLFLGEGFLFQGARLNLSVKKFHGHSFKDTTSKTWSNRHFESKCRREIILDCSTVVRTRWFYQKWLKMTRYTAPVHFVRFMEKYDDFRSFFTAFHYFLFEGFLFSFCGKPETVFQRIIFSVYLVY